MKTESERIFILEQENSSLKAQLNSLDEIQKEKEALLKVYNDGLVKFRTIFEESSVGKKIINEDLEIIEVNKALVNLLGYDEAELVGNKISEFTKPDMIASWEKIRKELWLSSNPRTSFSIDTCLVRKDQSVVWCHVTSILFWDGDQRLGYTILENITDRKESEQLKSELTKRGHLLELRNQEQKLHQELFESTVRTQEEERERIAEQLHNSLGQMLYAIKLNVDQIELERVEQNIKNLKALEKVRNLLYQSIDECRRTSHGMLPKLLRDFGLKVAIDDLCDHMSPAINVKLEFNSTCPISDKYIEVVVYRILQELLLNVVKHAGASDTSCKVEILSTTITITVRDNGKGFSITDTKNNGIGLSSIKSRVDLLKGVIDISSKPGEGTSVRISLPTGSAFYNRPLI